MDQGKLVEKVQRANTIRDFINHPGFQILKEQVEERISDSRHSWLKAKDKEQAESIRLKAGAYQDIYDLLAKILKEGMQASDIINKTEV